MATYIVPTRNDIYSYTMKVELEGTEYTLSFMYNFRDLRWYMSIKDFIDGVKLAHTYDFLKQYVYLDGFPPGVFSVIDQKELDTEPDIDNFGDTVVLIYEDS